MGSFRRLANHRLNSSNYFMVEETEASRHEETCLRSRLVEESPQTFHCQAFHAKLFSQHHSAPNCLPLCVSSLLLSSHSVMSDSFGTP